MHFGTTTGLVGFQWVIFSASTFFFSSSVLLYINLSKGLFNLVLNFALYFWSHFQFLSVFKEDVSVACRKPRTADSMFVFLLTLPTKLQDRLVCLFLWYFNCSLCKLNYARNSTWTFYQNKYLVSVPAPLVASVSFPQNCTRLGGMLCFATQISRVNCNPCQKLQKWVVINRVLRIFQEWSCFLGHTSELFMLWFKNIYIPYHF